MGKSNDEQSNDTGKIIGAALIGAAIGGALGILFAPAKGSETRKNILAKGDQIKDTLLEKFGEMMDSTQKEGQDVREKMEDVSKNGSIKA